MADDDAETAKEASRPLDAEARATYESRKTGDPIGDASLRESLGVRATTEEQQQLDDQLFESAFSPSIAVRARFEAAATEGAPSARHAEEYETYLEDVSKALVDRDPAAYVRAREALGVETTPEDLARFKDPSPSEAIGAARQAELTGVEIPEDSALAEQVANVLAHVRPGATPPTSTIGGPEAGAAPSPERRAAMDTARDDVVKATLDRDLDAFLDARDRLGVPATPEEIRAFTNPTSEEVLELGRHHSLLGVEIPEGSGLDNQIDNIVSGNAPGVSMPTNTTGLHPGTGSGTGTRPSTQTGSGPASGPGSNPNAGTEPPVDRSDMGPTDHGVGNPGAGGTSSGSGAPTSGDGNEPGAGATPSPIDTALGNLQGGAPSEPEIPTSRGGASAGNTDGLGWPGGVGGSGDGIPAGDAPGAAPPAGDPLDDSGADMEAVEVTPGVLGYIWVDDGKGGQTPYDPNTGEAVPGASAPPADAPPEEDEPAEDPPEEDKPAEDEDEDKDDDKPAEDDDDDDDDEGAMVDPDAGGGANPLGVSSSGSSTDPGEHISSTGGIAVTNTGRGDLDGGAGPITGEVRPRNTAGPDVDPDADGALTGVTAAGDGTDVFVSSTTGPAVTNFGRGDLSGGLGPIQPPEDDGVNPYAGGHGAAAVSEGQPAGPSTTGADTSSGGGGTPRGGDTDDHTVDHTAGTLGGDGLQSMDGTADLSGVADTHLEIDVGAMPDDEMEQDAGAFGGPPDDGFD